MLNFFFSSTAFAVSPNVQAINDVLFPVFLFGVIFMTLCNVFLDTSIPAQETASTGENVASGYENNEGDDCSILEHHLANAVNSSPKPVELFNVEIERDSLRSFGVRKLRAYCKQRKLKGYSTPASAGIDVLAEFMLQHQICARDVERFDKSKIVA